MDRIVCTASIDQLRLNGFLQGLRNDLYMPPTIVVVDTKGGLNISIFDLDITYHKSKIGLPHRKSCCVMHEKIQAMARYCNNDTIAFLFDDDYAINPHTFEFADTIMSQNPQVNYLNLLRATIPHDDYKIENLSGFRFSRWDSMLGGSMIVRWSSFYPVVTKFFEEYRVTGESSGDARAFDQFFWNFLKQETGVDKNVYMIMDFGLIQHCNLESHYPRDGHSYGLHFDSRCNPFKFKNRWH